MDFQFYLQYPNYVQYEKLESVYHSGEYEQNTTTYKNEYYYLDNKKIILISMIKFNSNNRTNCVIDSEDFDRIKHRIWFPHRDKNKPDWLWYVLTGGGRKSMRLHRLIMNPPDNLVIDHLNRNPLDNRKINLRICTTAENNKNITTNRKNTSGVRGVYYHKTKRKWFAFKSINGKYTNKGFDNFEDAVMYRQNVLDKL